MKRACLVLLLLPIVAGCKPSAPVQPLSPTQYRIGKSILQDEFNHQEITREKGIEFLGNLQDGAQVWQYQYGTR